MLEFVLHPAIVVPTVILMFLPWNAYLRVGLWLFVLFALLFILNLGSNTDGLGAAVVGILIILLFFLWGVAGLLQLLLRRAINGEWPQFARHRSDVVFRWAGYALLALCVFLFAAFRMAGTEYAFAVHTTLLAIAAACIRAPAFAMSLTLLTCYSLFHAHVVTNAASSAVGGAEHCIYLNQRDAFADGWRDLTFLTMDKGDWTRHAYVIAKDDPTMHGYWSYRQRDFKMGRNDWTYPQNLVCPTD